MALFGISSQTEAQQVAQQFNWALHQIDGTIAVMGHLNPINCVKEEMFLLLPEEQRDLILILTALREQVKSRRDAKLDSLRRKKRATV